MVRGIFYPGSKINQCGFEGFEIRVEISSSCWSKSSVHDLVASSGAITNCNHANHLCLLCPTVASKNTANFMRFMAKMCVLSVCMQVPR